MRMIEISEDTRATISNALRVAAHKYREDAIQLSNIASLRMQFDKRADEAEALADDIDNAEFIQFGQSNAADAVPFRFIGKSRSER